MRRMSMSDLGCKQVCAKLDTQSFNDKASRHSIRNIHICRDGEMGRHARLKIWFPQGSAGSTPAPGTIILRISWTVSLPRSRFSISPAGSWSCPLPTNRATEPLHTGQTRARCADNGYSIGKRRNAGLIRVQGLPSGEPSAAFHSLARNTTIASGARLAYDHRMTRCGMICG